ncbi:MAG: hypothetical protein ACOCP8_10015 [archaeon]
MYDDINEIFNIEDHKKREKAYSQLSPHVIIEVFINEENEIEDYKLLEQYFGGQWGDEIKSGYNDDYDAWSLDRYGLFDRKEVDETNALYHVSIYFHWYESGWEYKEWDMTGYITNVVKIKSNYRDYLNKQDKYYKQKKIKA